MSNSRTVFLKNEAHAAKWRSIVNSDEYESAIMAATAAMAEQSPSSEQMRGAMKFAEFLKCVGDAEAPEPAPLSSGLNYDLDVKERNIPKSNAT